MRILAFLDLLLPRSCLLCGGTAKEALCVGCSVDLPLPEGAACPRCAAPLAAPAPACADCLRHPPAFDATQAALRYTYPVDRLIQQLKFGGRHAFRRLAAADFLAARLLAGPHPAGDVIVPVPLSRQRLAGRGFNQALEIARPLARALHLPLDAASLVRVRETPAQSRLPWRARRANVRRVFECRADFSGKGVIVVDDVMTSGATLDAVARVLKDHGAARVTNWIAARAARPAT
jgi:ComF family protein